VSESSQHDSFSEMFVRYQHRLFAYIVTLVADRTDADEIFQQTSLTLWQQWQQYDPTKPFLPWSCGIALNHARNHWRKQKSRAVPLASDVLEQLAIESERILDCSADRLVALRVCMRELTEKSRSVVEAYYLGRSIQSIADERAVSSNSVYKLLHRVRRVLLDCVQEKLSKAGG
jgi:RNA polymerase sigma-70 factor, ECF subfamily